MNTAARLEAFNKEVGSSICIGPVTAAKLGHVGLRRMGTMTPRGQRQALDVYTVVESKDVLF
jgi:adenylate cyclase